jgi:hypothetical protein
VYALEPCALTADLCPRRRFQSQRITGIVLAGEIDAVTSHETLNASSHLRQQLSDLRLTPATFYEACGAASERPVIISHRYRYVFLQLPHSGSTAVGDELVSQYDGAKILEKHSNYLEFLRAATPDERRYFVFSTLRNPLDEAVTRYFRYKTNHRDSFTNPAWRAENGGWVTAEDLSLYRWVQEAKPSFPEFVRRVFTVPYDNWSCLSHHRLDYIIRVEALAQGFSEVLKRLGIDPKRELPVVNRTPEKSTDFLSYYTPEMRPDAVRIFGPFMREWGYDLPGWGKVPVSSTLQYSLLKVARRIYWGYLATSPGGVIQHSARRINRVVRG